MSLKLLEWEWWAEGPFQGWEVVRSLQFPTSNLLFNWWSHPLDELLQQHHVGYGFFRRFSCIIMSLENEDQNYKYFQLDTVFLWLRSKQLVYLQQKRCQLYKLSNLRDNVVDNNCFFNLSKGNL